jgi:integrative and conjugative element protein (TIGR02256 family)
MPGVWIGVAERATLAREADRTSPRETGGILMGYRGAGETIVIASVVGPGPNAAHGYGFFVPDHEYHEREVARIYENSGRQWTYLGDWHSHPGGSAGLSKSDRHTLRRIAKSPEARAAAPLMLVLAGGKPWELAVHRAMRKRWRIRFETLAPVK